jgi:hypothetical protein
MKISIPRALSSLPLKFKFGVIGFSIAFDSKTGLDISVSFPFAKLHFYESQTPPDGNVNWIIRECDVPYNRIPYLILAVSFVGYKVCVCIVDTTTFTGLVKAGRAPTC